jgi:hypothetical protein
MLLNSEKSQILEVQLKLKISQTKKERAITQTFITYGS